MVVGVKGQRPLTKVLDAIFGCAKRPQNRADQGSGVAVFTRKMLVARERKVLTSAGAAIPDCRYCRGSRSSGLQVQDFPSSRRYNLRGDGASEPEATSDWAIFTIGSVPSSCHRHPIDPPQHAKRCPF
jgi:hypothetical protein